MVRPRSPLSVVAILGLVFALSACQTTSYYKSKTLETSELDRRILLMPADVELSELSAGGQAIPNAQSTEQANGHIRKALDKFFGERQSQLTIYKAGPKDEDPSSERVQLIKLSTAVGKTAIVHHALPAYQLPSKKGKFDWTLGPHVKSLRSEYDARYGLFITIRDSYTSGGRAAVILFAALLGVGVQGGTQTGYATLVDLDSGEIVWFNVLARGTGDLRTYQAAEESVKALLLNFPK